MAGGGASRRLLSDGPAATAAAPEGAALPVWRNSGKGLTPTGPDAPPGPPPPPRPNPLPTRPDPAVETAGGERPPSGRRAGARREVRVKRGTRARGPARPTLQETDLSP